MRLKHVPYFTAYIPTLSWTSASNTNMKKAIFSSLIFLFLGFTSRAQLPDNRIPWSANLLTWQDFLGNPDPSSPFHANTSSGISYSWSMKQVGKEVEFIYEVNSYFTPVMSWVKEGKMTPHLLAHEQLHFDITELHARKLRKIMQDFDYRNTLNLKSILQANYMAIEASLSKMQKAYDAESRHSINLEQQLKWQKYIKEELEKLEEFSS